MVVSDKVSDMAEDAAHGSGTPVKQNKDEHENAFALLNIKPLSFGFSEWRGS